MSIRKTQGFLFAYHLTNRWLVLKFLRLVPIGWIRVENIRYIRRANSIEFIEPSLKRIFLFWRYWYWPYPLSLVFNRTSVLYMLKLKSGYRVFLRMEASFHFLLRTAVGASQVHEESERPASDHPLRPSEFPSQPEFPTRPGDRPRRDRTE